jgi:ribonuclease VapC
VIVDSSALLAIILDEPDAARFALAIADAEEAQIGAPNWVEVAIVTNARADETLLDRMERFASDLRLGIAPFLQRHALGARRAWQRFGRGRHPARLNYGDCMAYGFAKAEGETLLFKGDDFALTDIEPALKD